MKIIITVLFLSVITTGLMAQSSTMWLMNGKKVLIQDYRLVDDTFDEGLISYTNVKGKQKFKDAQDVFSIGKDEHDEKVFYAKDIERGNEFEVGEMRNFLQGKTDIKKTYKGTWATIGGFAAGLVGAWIPPIEAEGSGGSSASIPYGPIVPVAYVLVVGNTTKTFAQIQKEDPEINTDEHYLMGCQKGIQEKRMRNSIIGAGVGILAGILTVSFVK